jgi:hypothetical protein
MRLRACRVTPSPCRVGGEPGQVYPAGAMLDEQQLGVVDALYP